MIDTCIYLPGSQLREDVTYLALRQFYVPDKLMIKPMCSKYEIHLMLMLDCRMVDFINSEGSNEHYSVGSGNLPHSTFSGILTSMKGSILFRGQNRLLVIHFSPTGFYRVFGISPRDITDSLGNNVDLLPKTIIELHDRLHSAKNEREIFSLTESFLLNQKVKQSEKTKCPGISWASGVLCKGTGGHSIKDLASHSNMTVKTFYRRFFEHVGVNPKLFERIVRFNKVLEFKAAYPGESWTAISHHLGYFDQMHLIKDFYSFAGVSPTKFFSSSPPPSEMFKIFETCE